MSYVQKNMRNVFGSIVGVAVVSALAIWQFYRFVTFEGSGAPGAQAGTHHLWWAIAMGLLACGAAFLIFSAFVRHDHEDDLHITSAPTRIK